VKQALCYNAANKVLLTAAIEAANKQLHKSGMNQKCGPMPNMTAALPNIGGTFCSTPHSLADAHY